MSVLPVGISGEAQYQISRSLRFNSADSAYLNRTPSSAGNRKTWTWSGWVKLCKLGTSRRLFMATQGATINSTGDMSFIFTADDDLVFQSDSAGTGTFRTAAKFRDVSAFYHFIVVWNSTAAANNDRLKVYVNGVLQTGTYSGTFTLNLDGFVNSANFHAIGMWQATTQPYDGYLTEVNFIDGQALTPSSFGETDPITGVWKPKKYTGTYGTNGFYLNFSDNSGVTATTLGKDYSGNGNNWTPNNFSVTAGAGNDSLVDVPTLWGSDTGAGGEVRGNYCTWNPLSAPSSATLSDGNLLNTTAASGNGFARGTIFATSGKWYFEVTPTGTNTGGCRIGITTSSAPNTGEVGGTSASWAYTEDGTKTTNGSSSSYGATYTNNDVIGVALDIDAGTLVFYKNGVSQGTAFTGISGELTVAASDRSPSQGATFTLNAGQRPFAYTAPSGFKALCTTNLPEPTIKQGDDYFNTVLWTGDGNSTRAITGVGFQPDFVWDKMRSGSYQEAIVDSVRGGNKVLHSNSTSAEDVNWQYGYVSSFDSDGFTIQAGSTSSENWNLNGSTFVAWNWKANGAGSSNTQGSITSTVSVNTTAGISILTYTGNGTVGATVGHGLGVTPGMVIVKSRSSAQNWPVKILPYMAGGSRLQLNTTDGIQTESAGTGSLWNATNPNSTVITLGDQAMTNANGTTYVAYCFAPVAGFSAFGSYTGNGSTDGPFVYLGFRPAFVVVKGAGTVDGGNGDWRMQDKARSSYNAVDKTLYANLSNAEDTYTTMDFLSNGFKLRTTSVGHNQSGIQFIYMAFAENPFKHALAR